MSDLFAELLPGLTLSEADRQLFAELDRKTEHEEEIARQRAALAALQREHAQVLIEFGVVGKAIVHTPDAPSSNNTVAVVYRNLRRTSATSIGETSVSSLETGGVRLTNPDNPTFSVDVPMYSRRDRGDIQAAGRYLPEEAEMVAGMAAELVMRAELGEFMLRPDLTGILDPGLSKG